MSEDNVARLKLGFERFERTGVPDFDLFDPSVELINFDTFPLTRPYHGVEGVIAWLTDMSEPFDDFRFELVDVGRRPARRLVRARGHQGLDGLDRRRRRRPGRAHPAPPTTFCTTRWGNSTGISGGWGQVIGGMGAISQAIARSAESAGAEIRTDAEVVSIDVTAGRVSGVTLADGTELRADPLPPARAPEDHGPGSRRRRELPQRRCRRHAPLPHPRLR